MEKPAWRKLYIVGSRGGEHDGTQIIEIWLYRQLYLLYFRLVNYLYRITEAKSNETENIAFLSGLSDAKLEKKLLLVREQMAIAETNHQTDAIELLKLWERQIIEARTAKCEHEKETNNLSEIEIELAELDAMEKLAEQRNEIIVRKLPPIATVKHIELAEEEQADQPKTPDIEQLKLF